VSVTAPGADQGYATTIVDTIVAAAHDFLHELLALAFSFPVSRFI
jgi:hypothetical protein